MGFDRPIPRTLEDVATPAPISKGIVTLDEIRTCLAIIAKAVIQLRAQPATDVPPAAVRGQQRGSLQVLVLTELAGVTTPLTATEIGRRIGAESGSVIAALKALVRKGVVCEWEHTAKQWHGRPVRLYSATRPT